MALYDSQYSLDQAYSPFTNKMMRPGGKKEFFYDQGGGKEFFYNQDDGLGLSSQMGQSALDDSYLKYQQQPDGAPGLGKTQIDLGLSSLMAQQPQATQNPNIDSGFYNSPEYQGLPKMGQQNSIQTKYFGQVDGFQGGMDAAYEAYLNKTGQPDQIIPGYAPGMDPSKQENQPRMLPGTGIQERPPSPLSYEEQVAAQQQKRLDGDMGRYIGIGEGPIMPSPPNYDAPEKGLNNLIPPPTPMPTSTPMPTPTPMPGDVGYVPYGSRNNQPPTPTPMPTSRLMPGDVGYVPYGSRNNQPLVQGLAGGGPVGTLSFVELLKQIMEN